LKKKLQNEVDSVLQGKDPTNENIDELKYCKMVLKETLRMKPPSTHLPRIANEDTELLGQKIYKNTVVNISIPGIHLNEDIWPNAGSFIPERFSEDNKKTNKMHPLSYIPFSFGQRNCIGAKLAFEEATVILAILIQNFEIIINDPKDVKAAVQGAVSPVGLKVKFISRNIK